ncbi:MAG: bifunctional adenosylcobinamide kinase/adenosylcobinamide-phosphate guanylyltransferase [Alphaproteobacteria bacterium]|uniref:Adenosylcobinamide kinase n=1 Tax=Candidatus Nitrobium versatile TaxID=2884831 RepID=A0A953M3H0_9BACT|nr:bifunctional adenosylcobinamide kinase/adenosylcobinamide-phosphate guanylyltransferase [Candidatus Nitrobium versatile]
MAEKRGKIVFVIGGAKSGKSGFALRSASACEGRRAYLATAQAFDREMEERIARHKAERSEEWAVHEEPVRIAALLKEIHPVYDVLLLDCLTLWISNLLLGERDIEAETGAFLEAVSACSATLFIVSNEVGWGIVPDNALSRKFRDIAGSLNQKIAAVADEVYLVTAGIPVKIK